MKKIPISLYIAFGFFLSSVFTYCFKISTSDLITIFLPAFLYVSGICFGIKGIIEFKKYNDFDGLTPISIPLSYMCLSAVFLALPSFFSTGAEVSYYGHIKGQEHYSLIIYK